jgi:hypothetical protein
MRLLFVIVVGVSLPWLLGGACAEHFFYAEGTVTECGAQTPVSGAKITMKVDDGIHTGQILPEGSVTDAKGNFVVSTGRETASSWITLTFTADGFNQMQSQLKGNPAAPVQLCMTRTQ